MCSTDNIMNDQRVQEIYEKYVKINDTTEYRNKYVPLPMHLNDGKWKWEKKDFARVIALLEFREWMSFTNKKFNSVLSFGSYAAPVYDPEYEYLQYRERWDLNYEHSVNWDLHTLLLTRKDFDFVMINQVIEHLYNPILALQNIYKYMAVGGIFYANVPVNNIPHSTPYHYYTGITPVGLGVMLELAGFEILKIGQWGSKEYLKQSYDHIWSDYTYSSTPGKNDMDCPLITWCFAIKR